MNRKSVLPTLLAVACFGFWSGQSMAVSEQALQNGIPSLAPMLETVTPAVVSIRVARTMPTSGRFFSDGEQFPPELRRFFQNQRGNNQTQQRPYAYGAGSGVIVDAEAGFVVTNHHVVNSASDISVQLADGRTLPASLVGSDPGTDLALLQVKAEELTEIELADIDTVQVGDFVVAIGNPFGIGQTVTSGIVSALGRTGLNNANYEDFIQTDAAINVGNSGGALVDMEGRLIGINTAIISGDGGNNGIGFAVPADMLAAVMDHLERDGEVRRGMLGVQITSLTADVKDALKLDVDRGALVTSVVPGSAAEQAGLKVSDVIVGIDGEAVESGRDLRNRVGLLLRDQEVDLDLIRDGKELKVSAIIGGADGSVAGAGNNSADSGGFRGASLRNLRSDDELSVSEGVLVDEISAQSRAWSAGLRSGDVIIAANRQPVADMDDFNAVIEDGGRFTALTVIREDRQMLLLIP